MTVVRSDSLLTGDARYLDDIEPLGTLHMAFLRSPYAHANISRIEVDSAQNRPGVHAVILGETLREFCGRQPLNWVAIANQRESQTYAMAVGRVRYAGQAVAAVIAESRALAEDAAELIDVHYEELTPVMDVDYALSPIAPLIVENYPDNRFGHGQYRTGDYEAAKSKADCVVRERFHVGRSFGCPLETRGVVASWDLHDEKFDIWVSTQGPHRVREVIAEVFNMPVGSIRVRVPHLGGGFGVKANFYGEEVVACLASKMIGRPVKYVEDRTESFVASSHAREQYLDVEVAALDTGRILGIRAEVIGVLGGEMSSVGMGPVWLACVAISGPYDVANLELEVTGVLTNRAPYGSFRGWGLPKSTFAMERMIDRVAHELDLDPSVVRKINFVKESDLPYSNGVQGTIDRARFVECLDRLHVEIQSRGWQTRRSSKSDVEHERLGIGVACFTEATGTGPSRSMANLGLSVGGFDQSRVEIDSTGEVHIYTGLIDMGQGLSSSLQVVAAEVLGVSASDVVVHIGDTAECPYTGYGTGGSRGAAVGSRSLKRAAEALRSKVLAIAAHQLEANADDLVIVDGVIHVAGSPTAAVLLADLAHGAYRDLRQLPHDVEPTLQASAIYDPPSKTYTGGAVAALVSVDIATGHVRVLDYLLVTDCGRALRPDIVHAQLIGGAATGIAGALYEELVYDDAGQLRTSTFMDYLMPTAGEMPEFASVLLELTGEDTFDVRGVGEAGTIPAGAAIASAVDDALEEFNVFIKCLPIRPETISDAASSVDESQYGGIEL